MSSVRRLRREELGTESLTLGDKFAKHKPKNVEEKDAPSSVLETAWIAVDAASHCWSSSTWRLGRPSFVDRNPHMVTTCKILIMQPENRNYWLTKVIARTCSMHITVQCFIWSRWTQSLSFLITPLFDIKTKTTVKTYFPVSPAILLSSLYYK